MKCWACALAVVIIAAVGLSSPGRAGEPRLKTCLSPGETRDTMQAQKLVQPYRAIMEASRGGNGESIAIKLCRLNALMVYQVTMLRHDGRLVYMLVDASNGSLLPPHAGP